MRVCVILSLLGAACASGPNNSTDAKYFRALKTNDQAELARLARDWSPKVRLAAVQRLDDQEVLAERVFRDKKYDIRYAALQRLTDQAALERIAAEHPDKRFRPAAVKRMNDQAALVKIATTHKDRGMRATATTRLTSKADLVTVMNSQASLANEIAHVGLLVHAPVFQRRFPGASLDVSVKRESQRYTGLPGIKTMTSDSGRLSVVLEGESLEATGWAAPFPEKTRIEGSAPVYANVPVKDLIQKLVAKMTEADCRELAGSPSPIVREAAEKR